MSIECPKCRALNAEELRTCGRCGTALHHSQSAAAPPPASAISFRRNQVVAKRYTVLDMIGRGGMGAIYRVQDNTLNEEVALKTLLPQFARDKLVVERFYNEARIARQLSHPNICRVHDIGIDGDIMYISMEVLKGRSLRSILDHLAPGQRLPVRSTLHVIDQLCAALEYAHQYTVHRDIKPENVMVAPDGHVKLMDFGISKLVASSSMTSASVVMGTPQYMSPEQLKDSRGVDGRADIFSVGVVLYEMLTGNLPTGVPKPASQVMQEVPPSLDPIIAKCVDPDPANRYQSAPELREALRPIREILETGADLSEPEKPPKDRRGALRKVAGVLLLLVILALGGVGLMSAEKGRRARADATPAPTTTTVGAPSSSRDLLERFAHIADHIESKRTDAARAVGDDDPTLAIGDQHWRSAQRAAEEGQESQALKDALRALQCFSALTAPIPDMVFIPPGVVNIGTESSFVEAFYIDQDEVSSEAYRNYLLAKGDEDAAYYPASPDAVTQVTFYDALNYAAEYGKRIPTEAEWVRAASFGLDTPPVAEPADPEAGGSDLPQEPGLVSACDDGPNFTPEVVAEDLTPSDCRNMAGNAREWTATPVEGPIEDATFGTFMMVRGADTAMPLTDALNCRTQALYDDYTLPCVGFRCVKGVKIDLPPPLGQ